MRLGGVKFFDNQQKEINHNHPIVPITFFILMSGPCGTVPLLLLT